MFASGMLVLDEKFHQHFLVSYWVCCHLGLLRPKKNIINIFLALKCVPELTYKDIQQQLHAIKICLNNYNANC